jgi:ABC-type spermidine/putrescine transport system permease subunit I
LTIREKLKPLALLTPAIALEVGLFFIPLVMLTMVSFTTRDSFFFQPKWTIDNYLNIFRIYSFDFQVTFSLVIAAACLDLLFGFPFTLIMTRRIRKYADFFRAIMLVPLFGELYIAYGFYYLFLPGGPLSFVFSTLGIETFKALYSTQAAVLALAIYTFPFAVYNIGIALQGIDPAIEESARCLGAGAIGTFFRVTLPMSLPGLIGAWLVSIGWGLGAFAIPIIMGGAVVSQRMLSVEIYSIALLQLDFGTASAIGVLLAIIAVIIFYLSLRASRGALI